MAARKPAKPGKKTAPASVVTRAVLTEQKIAECMAADQGNAFRHYLRYYIPLQEDAFRAESGPRPHLGASLIGGLCDRKKWYGFRWATIPYFDGQTLRLFNRGHLEEARFLAMLASIGCTLYQLDQNGKQFNIVGHGGHYGGSLDCVVEGCPDWPTGPILGEFKTANKKNFDKVVAEGVQLWKPEYYSQCCQYMPAYDLPATLFMVVCKDTDEIYCEIITRNDDLAATDYSRAGDIIFSESPPPRVNESPAFWACTYCDHAGICHEPENNAVAKSCRTCAHVTVAQDGRWLCENPAHLAEFGMTEAIPLDKDSQLVGCGKYEPYTDYIEN